MRCIHWHHIRGYKTAPQIAMYIIRRILGLNTPSADLIGCKHDKNSMWYFNKVIW